MSDIHSDKPAEFVEQLDQFVRSLSYANVAELDAMIERAREGKQDYSINAVERVMYKRILPILRQHRRGYSY